jgi:hypothetical protein
MSCNVHRNRFSNVPEAIPFLAEEIAREDQKRTERTGNKPESTKIWGRYKTFEEDPTTETPDKSGRIPHNLPD